MMGVAEKRVFRVRSVSDDDLCAGCGRCKYMPGEMSSCAEGWPGLCDDDGYILSCVDFDGEAG